MKTNVAIISVLLLFGLMALMFTHPAKKETTFNVDDISELLVLAYNVGLIEGSTLCDASEEILAERVLEFQARMDDVAERIKHE